MDLKSVTIKIDRLSEGQNQENLATQSHGSKVILDLTRTARLPKSAKAGMTLLVIPALFIDLFRSIFEMEADFV